MQRVETLNKPLLELTGEPYKEYNTFDIARNKSIKAIDKSPVQGKRLLRINELSDLLTDTSRFEHHVQTHKIRKQRVGYKLLGFDKTIYVPQEPVKENLAGKTSELLELFSELQHAPIRLSEQSLVAVTQTPHYNVARVHLQAYTNWSDHEQHKHKRHHEIYAQIKSRRNR